MALRNIRLVGDEILRKKSKPVTEINKKIIDLLDDMADTMRNENGVGIAAVQVGALRRIVLVDTGEDAQGIVEMINPEIIEIRGCQTKNEGCLSLPGKTGKVERPEYVKVKYRDRNFEEKIIEGEEMIAVAFCHELDHLDGILYTDKVIEMDDDDDDYYDEEDMDEE